MGRLVFGEVASAMKRNAQRGALAEAVAGARRSGVVDAVEWKVERSTAPGRSPPAIDLRDVVVGFQLVEQIATTARASLARVI